jgi:hypothetical protein
MKNNKFQLTNPIPYKVDITIRGIAAIVKVENPKGLNQQKITIKIKKQKKNEFETLYELSKEQIDMFKMYLDAEGFLEEARQHNLYFEDEQ